MLKRISSSKNLLIAILIFTSVTRLYRLDYPNGFIFDEVYHAFTAKEYLEGSKEAWEWWTTPPPGVAYEWTHPPLAKEVMTASMFITGSIDAWAWRLPGALFGVLSVYLVYLLGLKLLNNQTASLIAAFAFSMDGLNFVQSRVGMNDIYFVTFILACLVLFLNKHIFWSALFLGLALSSKWATIYIYLIIIPLLIFQRRFFHIIYFIFIPVIIYLIAYIPFLLLGHTPEQFIQLQQQIWWYHTNLKATHDYASPWWSWPLNLYPVWYFVDYKDESIANIFASGNPAVLMIGIGSLVFTLIEGLRKKSLKLLLIVSLFFVFWLPWSVSPRIMFSYHFSPSIPFLCLAAGYQLNLLLKKGRIKTVILLLALMIVSFILLFPFLTGIPLPKSLISLFFFTNLSKNPFN